LREFEFVTCIVYRSFYTIFTPISSAINRRPYFLTERRTLYLWKGYNLS